MADRLVIVGGGPGGYAAGFLAADLGSEVTIVDPGENPGGVCLYRGCIPSKALLHVARFLGEVEAAKEWGIGLGNPDIDIDALRRFKNETVKRLTGGLGQLAKRRKIRHIQGTAQFTDGSEVLVTGPDGEKQNLPFDRAIVATGSVPAELPNLSFDSQYVLSSTDALELPEVPDTLLVVGAGYIGMELGTVYARLGSRVTIVELMDQILPGSDKELVGAYLKHAEALFEEIRVSTKSEFEEAEDGMEVVFRTEDNDDEEKKTYDKVLLAVGRKPNLGELGLEHTDVKIGDAGFIEVDEQRRTGDERIYAIGDVTGNPLLAHKAAHEGRTAAEAIHDRAAAFDPRAIPAVAYTDPEIAWCGMTAEQAAAEGLDVETAKFPWAASGRNVTMGRSDGLTKLIIEKGSERLVGVGIVGTSAGELIGEAALAVEMAATARDLQLTIHSHPTLSETLMEAAAVFYGTATHLYRPKRGE